MQQGIASYICCKQELCCGLKKTQTFLVAGMSEATHASTSRIVIGKPSGDFTCTLVSKNVLSSSTRGEGLVDVQSTGPVN